MAFQLSPGVSISEVDLTTIVPSVSTTAGAYAGYFRWGPVNKITLVSDEIILAQRFGTPDSNSAVSFFTAANFLSYGNNLNIVRTVGQFANNASVATSINLQIKGTDTFQYTFLNQNNNNVYGPVIARYPGAMGNSLQISIADANNYGSWAYSGYFSAAPSTSTYVSTAGGANDEIHMIVIDAGGAFTGTKGTVLETFPFMSKASDASLNGKSNFWKQVIFDQSRYIFAMDPPNYSTTNATWNKPALNNTFATLPTPYTVTLVAGNDDIGTTANTVAGFAEFSNKESVNVDLVMTGGADVTTQQYVIDNIVGVDVNPVISARRDCVAFISPPISAVVNNPGGEMNLISTWLTQLSRASSYVMADSGWKYQFDRYNNVYRWIPLNGDIAGLCVNTDAIRDPWFSPAGLNRGAIKNAIKLAWNPNKTYRDILYSAGVNPVVSLPGSGTVLFGDKTLQPKPSAFDRINVRRLFITLEKAIAKSAQYSMFEFNDEFTRAQFVSTVTPFLRDIQGRRGITDFKVVCDTTNNTAQVIDSNQFVGDIYVKPARSINFIQLNFIAVATGVSFTTVVGSV
jgi:hypothetical protein